MKKFDLIMGLNTAITAAFLLSLFGLLLSDNWGWMIEDPIDFWFGSVESLVYLYPSLIGGVFLSIIASYFLKAVACKGTVQGFKCIPNVKTFPNVKPVKK